MAFLLNQQVTMQQNISSIATEVKTALCDIAVQVQKFSPTIDQETAPRISLHERDIPHVAPPKLPLPQYTPLTTTASPSMLLVPAQPQFVQSPSSVPQQPPPPTNAELILDLQHLVGPGHGAPVEQRTVQSTPGNLPLGHMDTLVETGTQGERVQSIVSVNDEVTR